MIISFSSASLISSSRCSLNIFYGFLDQFHVMSLILSLFGQLGLKPIISTTQCFMQTEPNRREKGQPVFVKVISSRRLSCNEWLKVAKLQCLNSSISLPFCSRSVILKLSCVFMIQSSPFSFLRPLIITTCKLASADSLFPPVVVKFCQKRTPSSAVVSSQLYRTASSQNCLQASLSSVINIFGYLNLLSHA